MEGCKIYGYVGYGGVVLVPCAISGRIKWTNCVGDLMCDMPLLRAGQRGLDMI